MVRHGQKQCTKCKEWKNYDQFYALKKRRDGLNSHCKKCQNEAGKKWRTDNPDCHKNRYWKNPEKEHGRHLKKKYGIDENEYAAMLDAQDGVCAICSSGKGSRRLAVDHDHETGQVRGLLCTRCNQLIGNAKEDPEIMRRAIEYIEFFKG